MISIVACCRGAKHCAHAARDFRSHHYFFIFLTNCLQIFTKFLYVQGFQLQNFGRFLRVSSSEYLVLLLATVVDAAVRTVTLPNLLLFRWGTCLLVLFRLLLITLVRIEDGKFISVWSRHPDRGCKTKDSFRRSRCHCYTQFSSSSLQIREAMFVFPKP